MKDDRGLHQIGDTWTSEECNYLDTQRTSRNVNSSWNNRQGWPGAGGDLDEVETVTLMQIAQKKRQVRCNVDDVGMDDLTFIDDEAVQKQVVDHTYLANNHSSYLLDELESIVESVYE